MKTRTRIAGCALALAIPFTLLPATSAAADLRTGADDSGGLLDVIGDLLDGLDSAEPTPAPTDDPDGTPDPGESPAPDATPEPDETPDPGSPTPAPTGSPTPAPSTPAPPTSSPSTAPRPASSLPTLPGGTGVLREGVAPASADRPLLVEADVPAERSAATEPATEPSRTPTQPPAEPVSASRAVGHDPALPTALGVSAAGLGVLAGGAVVLHRRLPRAAHRLPTRRRHRAPGPSIDWRRLWR